MRSNRRNLARRALLIGNATFDNQGEFPDLRTPVNNVQDFATVLEKYCDFEIAETVINETAGNIRETVVDFFHQTERGDLTLLYYSGHGYRDQHDRYYLTAKDSQTDKMMITAVRESFIHDVMSESHAKHFIIILDSCFSGGFINGQMSAIVPLSLSELKGEARIVLASSSKVQYSFEGEEDGRNSLFTRYLIEGIATGQADIDQDGRISIEELFYYAESKVRAARREESNYLKQTPLMESGIRESEVIIIANNLKERSHEYSELTEEISDSSYKSESNIKSRGFVPGYQYDIFVSYTRVDDMPISGQSEGWVTTLVKSLKVMLAQRLGATDSFKLWMDHQLAGNVPIIPEVMDIIRNTATFVIILSHGYLASDWCKREKNSFLQSLLIYEGINSGCRIGQTALPAS